MADIRYMNKTIYAVAINGNWSDHSTRDVRTLYSLRAARKVTSRAIRMGANAGTTFFTRARGSYSINVRQ